jgi:hypothetical protein
MWFGGMTEESEWYSRWRKDFSLVQNIQISFVIVKD